MDRDRVQRQLVAILAADVVGYSKQMRDDEARTLEMLRSLRDNLLVPKLTELGGRLVKTTGDGFLAVFQSAVDAVRFANTLQQELNERKKTGGSEASLELRIGINVGDIIVEDDDVYGDGVNVAARLEGIAEPGGICISSSAYEQVKHMLRIPYEELGPKKLKNIDEPVLAYRILPEGSFAPRPKKRRKYRIISAAVVTALILIAIIVWNWPVSVEILQSHGEVTKAEALAGADIRDRRLTIAVLPFLASSDGKSDDWLGEGFAENLMTELTRFRDIGVVARNSSFRYGSGAEADIRKLGSDLRAEYALQGSVRTSGDQVRISLQLVDTKTGVNRWADRYDRLYADIFKLEAEIASTIASKLVAEARSGAAARTAGSDPTNLEAYELVLRARAAYYAYTKERAVEALALLERAVELDPNYAPAYAMLSRMFVQFYVQPYDDRRGDKTLIGKAVSAGKRAVELDRQYSTGHAMYGSALMWAEQYEDSLSELRAAIELNPNDVDAVMLYSDSLARAGYPQLSLDLSNHAEQMDPQLPPLHDGLKGRALIFLNRFDEAFEATGKCIDKVPNLFPCLIFHAAAASGSGRSDDAKASAARMLAINPGFTVTDYQRIVNYARPEDRAHLRTLLEQAGLPS